MAKRTAREFAATLEQQLKQFRPVRGEQHAALKLLYPHSPSQQEAGRAAELSSLAIPESYTVFGHDTFMCVNACNMPATLCAARTLV